VKLETSIQGQPGKLEINGANFRYQREDGQFVEGKVIEGAFDREPLADGQFSILINGRVYRVAPGAPGEYFVNGMPIAVEVLDPRALRSRGRGASKSGQAAIAAQMPGKIIRVLASAGDQVEAGQGVVVVEAMKMQNEMKSPKTGRVVEVRIKPGAAVAAGEVLMVVE